MMETLNTDELCFPQLLNASCRKPPQHLAQNVFIFMVLCLLTVLTVTLNLLVIISVSHFRQLHTPTNLLLLSLAVSDFLVGFFVMPIRILLTDGCWVLGTFMCGMFNFASFVLTSVSVGTMVLISADRYVAICDPLRYHTKVTLRRVQVCVCLCWAASILYNGVILRDSLRDPDKYNHCFGECVLLVDSLTGVFDVLITFFCPIIIIVVLYMRVFVVAVSQARAMRSHNVSGNVKKSERKAAAALGVVVFLFLVCFCPYFLPSVTGNDLDSSHFSSIFGIWLFYGNSCLNPLIYAFFYPWFRKSLKSIVTLQILKADSCNVLLL